MEVDQSPQDVWYGLEDLWLRLAAELPVRAEADDPLWRLALRDFECHPVTRARAFYT